MAPQRKIALGLTLFGAAQHGVQLVDGLARHERAQQRDRGTDHRQIDLKVRVGIAELRADVIARQQHGFNLHPIWPLAECDYQRYHCAVADQAPDQKGCTGPVEHRFNHFDRFGRGAGRPRLKMAAQLGGDATHRDFGRRERLGKGQVGEHVTYGRLQRGGTHQHQPELPTRRHDEPLIDLISSTSELRANYATRDMARPLTKTCWHFGVTRHGRVIFYDDERSAPRNTYRTDEAGRQIARSPRAATAMAIRPSITQSHPSCGLADHGPGRQYAPAPTPPLIQRCC